MSQVKSSNRNRAPWVAETVDTLREVFGEVKVLYAYEGDFEVGEPQPEGAPCIHASDGRTMREKYERTA